MTMGEWIRAHPGVTLAVLFVLAFACWQQRRVTEQAMAVIAVAAVAGAAAALAYLGIRVRRYLMVRRYGGGGAPPEENGAPAPSPVEWDAGFAKVDEEYRR
jgi:hypothetical protein